MSYLPIYVHGEEKTDGLGEFFLWQLEHEVETSRKVIERVPEGRNSWKPHERSMSCAIWPRW